MNGHREALARSSLLLNQELFAGRANEEEIADALCGFKVRFCADRRSLETRAGQTAVITAFNLTARLGIAVDLDLPNVPVIDPRAPLRREMIRDALLNLGEDLVPDGGHPVSAMPGCSFCFGSAALDSRQDVRALARNFTADLSSSTVGPPCHGELPFGGFAVGAAVAAVALERAVPCLEKATGLSAKAPRPSSGPPVNIDLLELFPGLSSYRGDLGPIDVVSGGAITQALAYCLLRVPDIRASMRIIEKQQTDLSNINRYALLRASGIGEDKVEQLKAAASTPVEIEGQRTLFTKESRSDLLPFAKQVLVGVDDVEARWHIQEEQPALLYIGATGNHIAQLSVHVPGGPCAGCAHTDPVPPGEIPTISFVSFWAGLLQACALLGGSATARNIFVYPFALGGPAGISSFDLIANPRCPLRCAASGGLAELCDEEKRAA